MIGFALQLHWQHSNHRFSAYHFRSKRPTTDMRNWWEKRNMKKCWQCRQLYLGHTPLQKFRSRTVHFQLESLTSNFYPHLVNYCSLSNFHPHFFPSFRTAPFSFGPFPHSFTASTCWRRDKPEPSNSTCCCWRGLEVGRGCRLIPIFTPTASTDRENKLDMTYREYRLRKRLWSLLFESPSNPFAI